MDKIIPNSVSEDSAILVEDNILSSPNASSQGDATSMSSRSSRDNKSPQTLLNQVDKESVLHSKMIKLQESNIKLEEDFAAKATQDKQRYEKQKRQNELDIEAVELVAKTQQLEAAKKASANEAKALKNSKSSDHHLRLNEAYQQYQEELLQVEKNFAENPFRKGTVRVPRIARQHCIDPKTLLKYVILFF